MPKKPIDPKAKAKRQKVIAAAGGVVLLGLLAFQIPRTMKLLHEGQTSQQSAPTTTAAAPAPGSTVPLAPPSLEGGTSGSAPASTATPSADGLVDSDLPPQPAAGQLVSFGRFQSKDPFAPQIDTSCSGASCAGSPGSSSTAPTTGSAIPRRSAPPPAIPGPSASGSPTGARLTTARISLNGVAETVTLGHTFPQSDPLFRLVSLTRTTAKIAIAGGSYEDGRPTVTLTKGKPLTLMNTADGARYQLLLAAVS